ncbi:MAG: YihY/virulence factor BrkB family protein [Bacteroidales bacterium]|nr:YihY/virulence factor BrkB family protein [Bacteroidales bacterium]MCF8402902.1 YihY/virulence factor BrkB family protein [Bacteroidales bacterium]
MAFNILRYKLVLKLLKLSKKIVLPGFDGLPLYDVAKFFIQGIFKGSITTRASSISFSFFLAIFPMIIAFFTLIPFVPIDNFQNILLNFIENITPDSTEKVIRTTLIDIIERPRGGLLSLTFFLAIVFATNGFDSIIEAFNSTYHSIETRSWFKQKLVSSFLFVIISIIIIISISLITGGTSLFKFLVDKNILGDWISFYLLEAIKWIVLIAMFFFTISFIFYFAPARASKFRFISAGSSLATFLAIIASVGFNYYVQNFSSYNALYGSIGTLLIILMWIYFNSIILLIGFELNASIQHAGLEKSH